MRLDACVLTLMGEQLVTVNGQRSSGVSIGQLRDELRRLGDRHAMGNLVRDLRSLPALVVEPGRRPTVRLEVAPMGTLTVQAKACCNDAVKRMLAFSALARRGS